MITIDLYRVRSGKWSPGYTKLTVQGLGGTLELTREAVDDIARLHAEAVEFERIVQGKAQVFTLQSEASIKIEI